MNGNKDFRLALEKGLVNDFKNRFKSALFWNLQIISLNDEIEEINYILQGTSAVKFNFDNVKLETHVRDQHLRRIGLYDKQSELIDQVEKYQSYFEDLFKEYDQIDEQTQKDLINVYWLNRVTIEKLGEERGYSESGMRKVIDRNILKALKG